MAVKKYPWMLDLVPDQGETHKMGNEDLAKYSRSLIYVPDWFLMQEQVKKRHDDDKLFSGATCIKIARLTKQK